MKKKIVASTLIAGLVLSNGGIFADVAKFKDMPNENHWSYPVLKYAVDKGYLVGMNGELKAEDKLTRAQLASILVRAFDLKENGDLAGFKDIKADAWYYDSLKKALGSGILKGKSLTEMRPNDLVSREEAMVVLARLLNLKGDGKIDLKDETLVSPWAREGVSALVEKGIVKGSNGFLNPKQALTRAEFASLLYALNKDDKKASEGVSKPQREVQTDKSLTNLINSSGGMGSTGVVEMPSEEKLTWYYGDSHVDQRYYPSNSGAAFIHPPFFNAHIAVAVDENGIIRAIKDNDTAVRSGNASFWKTKQGSYWKLSEAEYDKFIGKTLEEVKALQMNKGEVDAITGATSNGLAIKDAIIMALEKKNTDKDAILGKRILPQGAKLEAIQVVESADGVKVKFASTLPEGFKVKLHSVRYGSTNETALPKSAYTWDNGAKTLSFGELKPGKYFVNIVDESGKWRSPDFESRGGINYPYFIVEAKNTDKALVFDNEYNLTASTEAHKNNSLVNIDEVLITELDAQGNPVMVERVNRATGQTERVPKTIEIEPYGHHGNINENFDIIKDGKLNLDALNRGEAIFKNNKKYRVEVKVHGYSDAVTEVDRTPKYTEGVFYGYGSGFVDTKPMPFRVTIDSNKRISDITVEPSEIASAYHNNTSGAPIPADNIDDGTVYSAVLKGEGRPEGKSIAALTLNKPMEEAVENLTILADIHELKGKVLAVYKKNTLSKLQLEKAVQEGFGDPSYKLDRTSEALQPPLEEEGEVQGPIPPESDLLPGFNSDRIISLVYHLVKEHYKEFNTRNLASETEKAEKLAKINAAFDAVSGATATGAGAAKTVLNALKKSNEVENIDITDIRIKSSNQREASSTRYFDYKDGQRLSLDNIAVTLYKKDGSTVDVPFNEFDQHGLKVIDYLRGRPVSNGMTLSISELGENYIHLGVLHEPSESLKMLPVYIIQAEASQQKELFVKSLEMREKGSGSWENVEFVKESDGSANRSQRITLPANVVNKLEGKEVEFRYVAKEAGDEGQTHYLNALLTNRDQLEFTGYENQIKIEDDILKDNKETGQASEYKLSRDSYESMLFYFTRGQSEPPQAKEEYSYTISANLYRKENGGAVNPQFTEKYGTFYSADGEANDFEIAQDKQIDFEVKISKDGNVISVTPVAKPEYQATDRDKPYWDRFLKWLNKEDRRTGTVTHKFADKSQGDVENMRTWRTEDNYEDRIDVATGATITSHMAKVAVLDAFKEYERERAAETSGGNNTGNQGGNTGSNNTSATNRYSSDKLVKPKSDREAFEELKTYLSANGEITNEALAYLDSIEIPNERNYHVNVTQEEGQLKEAVISTTDNSQEAQEAVRLANEFIAKFWADTWDGYYDELLSYFRNLDSRRQYVARTQPNDLELFDNTVQSARLELNLALVAILKELPRE